MKDVYAALLGFGGVALGAGVVCALTFDRVNGMDDKLTGISRGMRYIQDNVSMDIPEEVAKELYRSAAEQAAKAGVDAAVAQVKKEVSAEINDRVKKEVKGAYNNISGLVQEKLEKEINLQTLDKIQEKVTEKVAKQLIDKSLFGLTNSSSKEEVLKACIDKGMATWEIERILKSMN